MDEFEVQSVEDESFALLRARMGISAVQLARAFGPELLDAGKLRAHFSEGASRSFFCRSANEDIILKTIEKDEVTALSALLPAYLKHLNDNPDSLLCRFLALLVVNVRGVGPLYCLVMHNSFPFGTLGPRSVVFDLKGSTVNRRAKVDAAGKRASLRLDEDFRAAAPLGVPLGNAGLVSEVTDQVLRDVTLLAAYGLMDYSCLVAVTPVPPGARARIDGGAAAERTSGGPPRRWSAYSAAVSDVPEWSPDGSRPGERTQVVVQMGVVDLLQQFDLGKQLENRFKRLIRVGRSSDISAVPAEAYAARFSDFVGDLLEGKRIGPP